MKNESDEQVYEIGFPRIIGRYIKYIYYKIFGIEVIHCIGDSHVGIFNTIRGNRLLKKTAIKYYSIGGATATGINNINSSTRARQLFCKYLKYVLKNQTILISLGEVDCDFLLWLKAKREKTNVNYQLDLALKRYRDFIEDIISKGFKNIILYSVPLPTILKNRKGGYVSDLRKDAKISIRKRTDLTIKFNKGLKTIAQKHKIIFLDISGNIIDSKTKLIDKKYVNPNRLDHHLYELTVIPIITNKLGEYGYE